MKGKKKRALGIVLVVALISGGYLAYARFGGSSASEFGLSEQGS